MRNKPLKTRKLSRKIYNRHFDFEEGTIKECYVVYHDKAVLIDATKFIPDDEDASRKLIQEVLDRLL